MIKHFVVVVVVHPLFVVVVVVFVVEVVTEVDLLFFVESLTTLRVRSVRVPIPACTIPGTQLRIHY